MHHVTGWWTDIEGGGPPVDSPQGPLPPQVLAYQQWVSVFTPYTRPVCLTLQYADGSIEGAPSGIAWHQDSLIALAGAPQAASAPFGYVTPGGAARVVYRDVNSNITETAPGAGAGPWEQDTLSAITQARPRRPAPRSGTWPRTGRRGSSTRTSTATSPRCTWRRGNPGSWTPCPPSPRRPQAASAPFGYVIPDGTARVIYQDVNNNITEMYLAPGQPWQRDDPERPSTRRAPGGQRPVRVRDPGRDGAGHLPGRQRQHHRDVPGAGARSWQADTLTPSTVAGAPQAASAPFGYVTPDGTARVIYRDANGNITEMYLAPGQPWQADTLSTEHGRRAPQAASASVRVRHPGRDGAGHLPGRQRQHHRDVPGAGRDPGSWAPCPPSPRRPRRPAPRWVRDPGRDGAGHLPGPQRRRRRAVVGLSRADIINGRLIGGI